jgi:hypothetical protein
MCDPREPDEHTMENRRAADALMREAAQRGCPIAGAAFELLHTASLDPATRFVTQTGYDYRDVDEDDDMRPY